MRILVIVICSLFATLAVAQKPPEMAAPQAAQPAPAPALPAIDPASSAALTSQAATIIKYQTQIAQLQAQIQAVNVLLRPAAVQWRITEAKALANANLDPAAYAVTISAEPKFIARPSSFPGNFQQGFRQ